MAIERKDTDELFDKIKDAIGSERLANAMNMAMDVDTAYGILSFIAKNYDIE